MVTNNVQSRTHATVDSVSSLSVNLRRHPNFVKSSSQLRYIVLVESTPSSSPDRGRSNGDTNRIVRLTADVERLKCASNIEFVHGYLSDLPSRISARNENCALLAPTDEFRPLIKSNYTTRSHLIRHRVPTDTSDSVVVVDNTASSEKKRKCTATTRKRTIGDMFAKMKTSNSHPEKRSKTSTEDQTQTDCEPTKSSKMQYGDHEYCSTKYPLVKAFQKQASKIRNPKPVPGPAAVKTDEPLPEVSATSSTKRQWIDTSSSEDEQKSAQPSTASSKTLTKRLRPPTNKQESSQPKAEVTEFDGDVSVKPPKVLSKPNVTREGASTSKRPSRSATKKMPRSQTQTKSILSFTKKSNK